MCTASYFRKLDYAPSAESSRMDSTDQHLQNYARVLQLYILINATTLPFPATQD